jgi:hypothetical protein
MGRGGGRADAASNAALVGVIDIDIDTPTLTVGAGLAHAAKPARRDSGCGVGRGRCHPRVAAVCCSW